MDIDIRRTVAQVKPIRFTQHALEQCEERGAAKSEVEAAIRQGSREAAKRGKYMYRLNLEYNRTWEGRSYQIKQVAPVVAEEDEIVVITVYTFYF